MTEPGSLIYGLALVPAVLWGSGLILDKRGMDAGGNALQAALVVVLLDSLLYWGALAVHSWPTPFAGLTPRLVVLFTAAGLFGTALGRILTFTGVCRVGAGITSAGISVRPLFAALLALGLLGEPLSLRSGAGVAVLMGGLGRVNFGVHCGRLRRLRATIVLFRA